MAIHRPVGPSGPFRGWKGRRAGRKGKRPLRKKQKRDGDLSEVCPPGEEECQDGGHGMGRRGGAAGRFFLSGHRHKTSFFFMSSGQGRERKGKWNLVLFYFYLFYLSREALIWAGASREWVRYGTARHGTAWTWTWTTGGHRSTGKFLRSAWEFHPW